MILTYQHLCVNIIITISLQILHLSILIKFIFAIYNKRLENIPKILETPYVTKDDNSKEKLYPPYKYEIEMIRNKKFDSEMIDKIRKEK